MRLLPRITALAALIALLPASAYAQQEALFAQPFQYTDRDGAGTLTVTPLTEDATAPGFRRARVLLERGAQRFNGAGVYHIPAADTGLLPPPTLIAFTLVDAFGRSYFFQGSITVSGQTATGQGTYFLVTAPETTIPWQIRAQIAAPEPEPEPIVNSRPVLRLGWVQHTLAEAIGGVYFATFNRSQGVVSTATWSGTLPAAGRYRVEVFIPSQRLGFTPRTSQATYQISGGDPAAQQIRRANQNVATAQWIDLGSFDFGTTYQVVLTDETGEPSFTRSVVANAVRLTRVPAGDGGGGGGGGF